MKSAKAARRSSPAFGSSTSGMSRVNGSSSTTIIGRSGMSGGLDELRLLRLQIDAQRREHAVVHQIGADQHRQLNDLALVVVLANRVEDVVRHLGRGAHRVDIG